MSTQSVILQYLPVILTVIIFIIILIVALSTQSKLPQIFQGVIGTIAVTILIVGLILAGVFWYLCKRGDTALAWIFFILIIVIPAIVTIAHSIVMAQVVNNVMTVLPTKIPDLKGKLHTGVDQAFNYLSNLRSAAGQTAQATPAM